MKFLRSLPLTAVIGFLAAALGVPPAGAQELRELFAPAGSIADERIDALLEADRESAKSVTLVLLNEAILKEAAGAQGDWQPFAVNLDDDLVIEMTTTDFAGTEQGAFRWVAVGERTRFVLIRHDGAVAGSVETPERSFKLYDTGTPGVLRLVEPNTALELEGPDQAETGDVHALEEGVTTAALCNADHGISIPVGKGPRPTILIVWTPAAQAWLTSQGRTIAAEVQLIMDLMGAAMQGTWFAVYPQLAGAQQIAHTEQGQLNPDLSSLTNGAIPGVAQLRNDLRADLVMMIGYYPGASACGLAWVNDNAESTNTAAYGFSVVNVDVDGSSYCDLTVTGVHEVGHNFGMRHDKANGGTSRLPYNFGHLSIAARARTIMAYDKQCSAAGVSCPRIARFSNPGESYPKGGPMGAVDAHNMETLCRTAGSIAKNRTP